MAMVKAIARNGTSLLLHIVVIGHDYTAYGVQEMLRRTRFVECECSAHGVPCGARGVLNRIKAQPLFLSA